MTPRQYQPHEAVGQEPGRESGQRGPGSGPLRWGGARVGAGRPALVVALTGPTLAEAADQARRAVSAGAEVLEMRVDLLEEVRQGLEAGPGPAASRILECLGGLHEAQAGMGAPGQSSAGADLEAPAPLLLTCRTTAEGGRAQVGDAAYRETLLAVLEAVEALPRTARPAAIDVEAQRGCLPELAARAHERGIDVVGSFHDFEGTPGDAELEEVLAGMVAQGADLAKVAVMPLSAEDVARLLGVSARMSAALEVPVAAMSMGALGAVSRVAPVFGSALTFVVVPDEEGEALASAPGQLPIEQVRRCLEWLGG
ncbi:type I 3-dehydroquinate dehydratase [Actinomyces bowdenii]|uniref:3-dehydroquinate dehydratase n=1 Tax=Actinomyces bowdenii TaxID=131109 RepID=A0A853EKK7_9ACTO|nr:type I 3-dehydroquinate dehydratase [Actinomyces bowdenii]MBF0697694.1 type I 3-dehydroquinate dehydratase [Actinomyces bowdenii]NYS69867.1 type I 3-dehydroquinate dehydratase [Actinomyces bowdenii]